MPLRDAHFPRARLLWLLVAAALALALAACGDDTEDAAGEAGEPTEDADGAEPGDAPEEGAIELEDPPELSDPVDLDDGVAALVDGEEIAKDTVEARFEARAAVPELAEQLEGEQGDSLSEMYRAQILQNLIIHRIVANGAEELGIEPSDEDLAAVEEQALRDYDGDREDFAETMEDEGMSEGELEEEFLFAARVEAIREEVADEAADVDDEDLEAGAELEMDPADIALQQWFGDRLAEADVAVDQEYGVWNPEVGEVVPMAMVEDAE